MACTGPRRALVFALVVAMVAACAARGAPAARPTAPPSEARTIHLDLRDAPIHDALRAIAAAAHVNVSVDPDVTGTVSIRVRDAPWREVLDRIAADHALRVVRAGPVIHIARATTSPHAVPSTGAPISLDLHDAPIRDAAALLTTVAGVPVLVDDDVDTLVTQVARDAPWDLVLDHLARKYSLRIIRTTASIRIAR
jgi:type II secretory pathway component HofQ